jgi:hypothetical protein
MNKMEEISEKRKSAIAKRWGNTNEEQNDTKKTVSNTNVIQNDTIVLQMYYKSTEKEKEIEIEKEKEYIETYSNKRGKPFGFNAVLLVLFCAQYNLSRDIPYTAKRDRDEKHMQGIYRQYMELKKAKKEAPDTEQTFREMRLLFRLACSVAEDDWIFTNMSPPILDAKFNQVMQLIRKNNGNRNGTAATKRQLADEDINEVGTRIFSLEPAGAVG